MGTMSTDTGTRGRTKPQGTDDSSESDEDWKVWKYDSIPISRRLTILLQGHTQFSAAATGRFRSRAVAYTTQAQVCILSSLPLSPKSTIDGPVQFPTAPLYQINEEIYRLVVGQTAPAGPYIVMAVLENKRYKLKRKDNGQEHPQLVEEKDLVIPAATT